jgi:hypothetical protein
VIFYEISGVDVMVTIFLKNNAIIKILHNSALFWVKNDFFRQKS